MIIVHFVWISDIQYWTYSWFITLWRWPLNNKWIIESQPSILNKELILFSCGMCTLMERTIRTCQATIWTFVACPTFSCFLSVTMLTLQMILKFCIMWTGKIIYKLLFIGPFLYYKWMLALNAYTCSVFDSSFQHGGLFWCIFPVKQESSVWSHCISFTV